MFSERSQRGDVSFTRLVISAYTCTGYRVQRVHRGVYPDRVMTSDCMFCISGSTPGYYGNDAEDER